MIKNIIPSLELDSNEFEKKVLISLNKTGNVRIVPKVIYDNKTGDLDKLAYVLMNTSSSKIKICPACCGKHRYFTIQAITDEGENEKGICDSCGIFLQNMVLLNVSEDKIKEWIKSEGKSDPHELMREAIQKSIDKGDIKMIKGDSNKK